VTEADARWWIRDRFGVSRETLVTRFVELVLEESSRQNLIAQSTIADIWVRHVLDSAQLVPLSQNSGPWLDIGSGAGFPGLVLAMLTERPVILVEPRRKRVDFLERVVASLALANVTICATRVQNITMSADTISARAVAALSEILSLAAHLCNSSTEWLLPKGKNGRAEVDAARQTWHGAFHVEQSISDPESLIVIARGVGRR